MPRAASSMTPDLVTRAPSSASLLHNNFTSFMNSFVKMLQRCAFLFWGHSNTIDSQVYDAVFSAALTGDSGQRLGLPTYVACSIMHHYTFALADSVLLVLGASLHDILTRFKSQPHLYPTIDVSYSPTTPLAAPLILKLSHNGIRLLFDGPDQRLRLIEILDFTKTPLSYKNVDIVKITEPQDAYLASKPLSKSTGPPFRHVYHKLFGPTFPGEYLPPTSEETLSAGTYILSYPGLAFSFPLQHSAWSEKVDFVSLLSSSAAFSAQSLAIFNGSSWKDARQDLYTRPCIHPRSLALTGRGREGSPDEIELVKICGAGLVEMIRRFSLPFRLMLGETTPQDLVAELGPPDAIYRKNDRRLSIHKTRARSRSDQQTAFVGSPGRFDGLSDTDRSSAVTSADDSDSEEALSGLNTTRELSSECFYNYFHHGFDVFVSYPGGPSPGLDPAQTKEENENAFGPLNNGHLVATKLLLHSNVPGSYPFNRYRRCRWTLDSERIMNNDAAINSETPFSSLAPLLQEVWKDSYLNTDEEKSLQRGMVLNRGWGDSPGSSCELLGGWEDSSDNPKRHRISNVTEGGPGFGNTELYGFPGLLFEVLKNDAVSCLTIY